MAVSAAWEDGNLLRLVAGLEHTLNALHRLITRDVSKPGRTNDITGSIDTFDAGLITGVCLQPTALRKFQIHAGWQNGHDANGDQADFCFDGFGHRAFDSQTDL